MPPLKQEGNGKTQKGKNTGKTVDLVVKKRI